MRTSSENDDSHVVDFEGWSISLSIRSRVDIGVAGPHSETASLTKSRIKDTADSTRMYAISMGLSIERNARFEYSTVDVPDSKVFIFALL